MATKKATAENELRVVVKARTELETPPKLCAQVAGIVFATTFLAGAGFYTGAFLVCALFGK